MAIETGYIPIRIINSVLPTFQTEYQTGATWTASQEGLVDIPDNRTAANYYELNVNDWMAEGHEIFSLSPSPNSVKIYAQQGPSTWGEVTDTDIDTEVTVSTDGGTTWTALNAMDTETNALSVDIDGTDRATTGQVLIRTPDVSEAQGNLRFVVIVDQD